MAEKDIIINDPCGLTNYDDKNHRREENQPDGPVKVTALMMATIERQNVETTEISNFGESRPTEVGDGKGISEGKGGRITAYVGGIHNQQEENAPKQETHHGDQK